MTDANAPSNKVFGRRCSTCDVNWPNGQYWYVCPVCQQDTWQIMEHAHEVLTPNDAVGVRTRLLAERQAAREAQADVEFYETRRHSRAVEAFREQLLAEPVANRFEIPPEERCPAYEADSNPAPVRRWRPPEARNG